MIDRRAFIAAVAALPLSAGRTRAGPPSGEAELFRGAIARARVADVACRETGRLSHAIVATGQAIPDGWHAHRADLMRRRAEARAALHALTPTTGAAATLLVAYHRDRAVACGDPAALTAARRRLRKVSRRPGAVDCLALWDRAQQPRASPV